MSWPLVSLSSLVEIKGGGTPSKAEPTYWNGDIPWASVKDFKSSTLSGASDYITQAGIDNSATSLIEKGNIIIPTRMALGKIAINTVDLAINQDLKALIIRDHKKVDLEYLFRCIQSKSDEIIKQGKGATVKGITLDVLNNLQIPLPPLETQKQIAAVLEKADQLRKDCKLLEQELNSLAQSVFIDMFGDPVTNPRGFDSKPLRELVSVLSGATPSKSNDNFWIGNVPWVSPKDMKVPEIYDSIDHVNEIAFTETNLKKIPLNSILIVVRGMILVHTAPLAITRKNLSINQDIKALTVKCNSIKSEFLLAVLSSMHSHLLSIISTAAHGTKRIDMADLLDLKIIVPSIQQQDQFIKTVITMRNMTATQQAEATLYENNFNALMQKAFSGELNLANAKT